MLVPELHAGDLVIMTNVKWILVVEKEAVFHKLISSDNGNYLATDGILLTGKGYPDISTRQTLHRLSQAALLHNPRIPIHGLVDYDPDGLSILNIYRHGSQNYRHANDALTAPHMSWLGPRRGDIFPSEASQGNDGLLQLTGRDRRTAKALLERSDGGVEYNDGRDGGMEGEWLVDDLRVMLMLNMKAEIEALYARPGGFVQWVRTRLNEGTSCE
ncbi:MAG: hypothetical protein M1831_002424 [Alyxoria varia]|nr:MAG: hypothetical protein M1831_002424 [Alyxoria varia]